MSSQDQSAEGFHPEIVGVQNWIENVIVRDGICPPVTKLMARYRDDQGQVDWTGLSSELHIASYMDQSPSDASTITNVARDYFKFISGAVSGTSPYTKVFILPTFARNVDYDTFMIKMTKDALLHSSRQVVKGVIEKIDDSRLVEGTTKEYLLKLLKGSNENQAYAAAQVILAFRPVYFYGREVKDKDVADMSGERGSRQRYKILSAAPYYLFQVVNILKSADLLGNLNREKLREHNTNLALHTNPMGHQDRLRKIREDIQG
jgi:hypothetical protein